MTSLIDSSGSISWISGATGLIPEISRSGSLTICSLTGSTSGLTTLGGVTTDGCTGCLTIFG